MSTVTLKKPLESQNVQEVGRFKTQSCHRTLAATSPVPWALKTPERLYARNEKAKARVSRISRVSSWGTQGSEQPQAEDSPGAAVGCASPGLSRALLKGRLEAWASLPGPSYLSFQGVFCVLHQDHLAHPPPYFVQLS